MPRECKIYGGQRIGHLTVLYRTGNKERGAHPAFLCRCDCGELIERGSDRLGRGGKQGCCKNCAQTLPNGLAGLNSLYKTYKQHAKKRGMDFRLSKDEFAKLTKDNCFYCNSEPSQQLKVSINSLYLYNGIDRINNTMGYVIDNCVAACGVCNWMKSDMDLDVFYRHIQKINSFRIEITNGTITATDLTD